MTDYISQITAQSRRVVVLGGTGRVGEGVVREWAAAGAEVIVPSRTDERAAELHHLLDGFEHADRVHTIVGEYTDFATATATADAIEKRFGPVTDVVASIGGWWQGTALWQTDAEIWQRYFVDLATAHMANFATWLPRLSPEGTYQLILGGSATISVPGAGVINMEQAALLMMAQTSAAEAGEQRRVFALVLGPVATRGRGVVDPTWISGAEVGQVTIAHALSEQPSAQVVLRTSEQATARITEVGGN